MAVIYRSPAGRHTPQFPDSSDSLEIFDVDNRAANHVEYEDMDIRNCFYGITQTIPNYKYYLMLLILFIR